MASLKNRLQSLEAQIAEPPGKHEASLSHRATLLLCSAVENARREQEGLSLLPLAAEEEQGQRELDLWFLAEGLPQMQDSPGWEDEESQALLNEWREELPRWGV